MANANVLLRSMAITNGRGIVAVEFEQDIWNLELAMKTVNIWTFETAEVKSKVSIAD